MDEAKEIELIRRLEALSPHLAERIKRLEQIVEDPLARIYSIFPQYTDHSKFHSEQVMTILGWLVPDNVTNPLSAQEIFYLLAAALLHDIGMLEAVEKVGDREAQEQIRESHHLRSEQYIQENYERLGLDKPEANAVGEICRSHRKTNITEDVEDVPGSQGTLIRMQLLCAALRIADELHLTADRAPQIVLDVICPPQDSVVHFEKHLSIDGVGPLNPSEGVIQINATVKTSIQERALHQMTEEIREKLTEVAPIFARHGWPWKKIELKLQRRKVVERKVILHLARFGESQRNQLAAKLDESQATIEICLHDLILLHYIQPGEKANHIQLVANNYTFEHLLREFLKTEEELEFVSSPYLRKCIEEFAFDNFRQQFDAVYNLQEKENRILVLQTSPTALYLLLFVSEFQVEAAIISRQIVLDGAILFGFLTDLFRFPEIAQIRGIEPAIITIQDKLKRESGHLLRLFSALGPDLHRDIQDVFKDLIPSPESKDADIQNGIDFKLTVSHPKSTLERGLTFPHLLKAAFISGEQLELVASRTTLSSKDPRVPREAVGSSLSQLIITPHSLPPMSGIIFCRVKIDHSRKQVSLFVDPKRSADYSKYPVAVRMTISQSRRNAAFSPSVYTPNADVKQVLRVDTMLRWIKSGDFHRLGIGMDQPELPPSKAEPFFMEVLGSDLKDKTVEPLFDDSTREILQSLAQLQDRIDKRIPCPIRLTSQQEEAIVKLARASGEMTVSKICDELSSIAEQAKYDWTTVRVSTYFPNEQIESDQFLGPFHPRIIPQIELKQKERNEEVAERLQKGNVSLRITKYSTLNVETLSQRIIDGFSGAEEGTILPKEPDLEETARTAYQVTFQFIKDKIWYREQVIHYQIRDISLMSDIFSEASRLLKQDQVADAIRKLTEGLKRLPNDASLSGLLGWAHYKAGDLDSAYKYSLAAVDLEQGIWSVRVNFAYYNLGLYCLLLDRFEEGISWYKEAIRSGPGTILDEAIEDLEAVITSKTSDFLYALALLNEQKNASNRAIELYREFLDSDSQYSEYKELAKIAIQRIGQSK